MGIGPQVAAEPRKGHMTEQTITIILWAIPISLSLIIAILVSKETHKPIVKTLVCWVLPVIAGGLLAGAVMWGGVIWFYVFT